MEDSYYLGFQKIVSYELLKAEASSKNQIADGWIELFFKFLFDYLKEPIHNSNAKLYEMRLEKVKAIPILSLNYDRLFEYKSLELGHKIFGESFLTRAQKRIGGWRKPAVGFFIAQAHGTIAQASKYRQTGNAGGGGNIYSANSSSVTLSVMNHSVYGENQNVIGFGDVNGFGKICRSLNSDSKNAPNLIAADDLKEPQAKLFTYLHTNSLLQNKNILVIGLSDVGFNNSIIDLSRASSIHTTNIKKEFSAFDKKRLPNLDVEQLPFGQYSIPFFGELTKDYSS